MAALHIYVHLQQMSRTDRVVFILAIIQMEYRNLQ